MVRLLGVCSAALFAVAVVWAQDKPAASNHTPPAMNADGLSVVNKSSEKRADKKPKPRPTKKGRKQASRSTAAARDTG